jgi:hypothetical protein
MPLVFSILLALAAAKQGKASSRPSAIEPSYGWSVIGECPGGAVAAREPLYPGRLAMVQDLGCDLDDLDVEARRWPFFSAFGAKVAVFAVPLEWEPGERGVGLCRAGVCIEGTVNVAEAAYQLSEINVAGKFLKPPPAEAERIKQDRELIAHVFSAGELDDENMAAFAYFAQPFMRPRPPRYTSLFGAERVLNHKQHTRHLGLDFDGNTGEPIYAAQDGIVMLARDLFYSGNSVFLLHGMRLWTTYFHMTEIKVREGQYVHAGDLLGLVGKTGRVTGPHLHFAAKLAGYYFDPEELFELTQQLMLLPP